LSYRQINWKELQKLVTIVSGRSKPRINWGFGEREREEKKKEEWRRGEEKGEKDRRGEGEGEEKRRETDFRKKYNTI
jgi:hypothetical protein